MLPLEDHRAHVGPHARHPVGEAVAQEKEGSEEDQPSKRAPPRAHGRGAHARAASDTVKMPQSSVHCSTLLNPARDTSWSISSWVRRRMTQGLPFRWLVSVRAM